VSKYPISWYYLSQNPNGIPLLEANVNKINWFPMSANPNGIHLLEKHRDKIVWLSFSKNPSIFEPDLELLNKIISIKAMVLDPIIN